MSPTNKRYLCIYFPQWSVDLLQRRRKKLSAALLVSKVASQLIVSRCCARAYHQGVRPGMPLPLAKAMSPEAEIAPFDPAKDFKALYNIAVRALRFAPLAGVDSDLCAANKRKLLESFSPLYNGIVLDITGTERLHKEERVLAEKIFERFAKLSIQAHICIGPTIGAAWAWSRFGQNSMHIIPREEAPRVSLAELPIESLRLPGETLIALHLLGIKSVAALLKLPSRQLGVRFGVELLKRMDQAFGALDESFESVQPPELIRALRRFEVPLTNQESIKVATLFLFQSIFKALAGKKKKAGCFSIILEGQDNERRKFYRSKDVFLHTTTKDFQHIASVLDPLIANLVIPGGVHALTVIAYDVERAHEEQGNFLSPADLHFLLQSSHELLNTLTTRLGKEQVATVVFQSSYIPERSFAYRPLAAHREKARAPSTTVRPLSLGRPPYLFQEPERVTALAMLPDKPPARLYWKGKELTVLQATGPERISPEWWLMEQGAQETEREYFRLQDQDGRWLWVFRDRKNMEWFVQGFWG
jgi:protein ImuB